MISDQNTPDFSIRKGAIFMPRTAGTTAREPAEISAESPAINNRKFLDKSRRVSLNRKASKHRFSGLWEYFGKGLYGENGNIYSSDK